MRQNTIALVMALSLFAGPARADNWADMTDPDYAKSAAICKKLKNIKLPAVTPTEKSSAVCDSEVLYYGIGRTADAAAARACALNHIAANVDSQNDAFDGWGMLATVYANGKGAPRDLDVATAFACRIDGAPAEIDGRILHLAKLKTETMPPDFDICDDATSGALVNQCASRDDDLAKVKREAGFQRLEAGMTAPQKVGFAALRKAEEAYVAAVGDNEVDMTGTMRGSMVIDAQTVQRESFMKTLTAVLKNDLPGEDAPPLAKADAALNATFVKVMRLKDPQWGTVEKSGIKIAQKAWLAYRDAFARFAAIAAPAMPVDRLKSVLTRERTHLLDNFAR